MKIRKVEKCFDCGYSGEGQVKGFSCGILFILFCFGIIPGIIYLIIVSQTMKVVCKECKSERVKLAPLK